MTEQTAMASSDGADEAPATWRYVARVTVEMTTPSAVRTGEGGILEDSRFVADANGLPALPGTSIAGVLRHAAGEELAKVFGGPDSENTPQGSRLKVSWAKVHDSHNRPVDGLLAPDAQRLKDSVLAVVREGVRRDHVRISDRGVASDRGKFDERLVPKGARFTFDLTLRGTAADAAIWERLLDLLRRPDLRFGGGGRRGFGAFKLHRLATGTFDLTDAAARGRFLALPVGLDEKETMLAEQDMHSKPKAEAVILRLHELRMGRPWLFDGGPPVDFQDGWDKERKAPEDRQTNISPMRESFVTWSAGREETGRVCDDEDTVLVPASSVKGALAHRVAWHYNRLVGNWVDADAQRSEGSSSAGEVSEKDAVTFWFGCAADSTNEGSNPGQPGRVFLSDIYVAVPFGPVPDAEGNTLPDKQEWIRHHVALDRFTGGTRAQALYQESVVPAVKLHDCYEIVIRADGRAHADSSMRRALRLALEDLTNRGLAVGAGGNRGYGRLCCDRIEGLDAVFSGAEDGNEPQATAEAVS